MLGFQIARHFGGFRVGWAWAVNSKPFSDFAFKSIFLKANPLSLVKTILADFPKCASEGGMAIFCIRAASVEATVPVCFLCEFYKLSFKEFGAFIWEIKFRATELFMVFLCYLLYVILLLNLSFQLLYFLAPEFLVGFFL